MNSRKYGQTALMSLLESIFNIGSGMVIAYCTMQYLLAPALGILINTHQNIIVTIVLTGVSMARSYIWRRIFNYLHIRGH